MTPRSATLSACMAIASACLFQVAVFSADANLIAQAKQLIEKNQCQQGVVLLSKALKSQPDDPELYYWRALCYGHIWGKASPRFKDLDRAIALNPKKLEYQLEHAAALLQNGRSDEAIQEINSYLTKAPNDANGYSFRGTCYFERRNFKMALSDCDKALALDPKCGGALFTRAHIHETMMDEDKELADLNRLLALPGMSEYAYRMRATILGSRGRPKEALADLNKSIELDPHSADSWMDRANLKRSVNDIQGAVSDYSKALVLFPGSRHQIAERRAACYESLGQWQKVVEDYTIALDGQDTDVCYLNRGKAYQKLGKTKEAIADFNAVMSKRYNLMSSTCNEALKSRAVALLADRQWANAITDFNKLIERDDDYEGWYSQRAKAYRGLGKNDLAKADEAQAEKLSAAAEKKFKLH